MTQRILISTGGSGGHVIPASILYEHLKDQFKVSMSTDYRGFKFIEKNKYNIDIFNVTPISKNIFLLPYQFLLLIYLIIKSIFFLKKKKNKYINFNRWLHVFTFVFSFKNFKHQTFFI
jgi:UDP-N-acetylglucosamine--N-acetylmuramyl-(pentapeptide) pyrophosphoryl-undecaprenol N-acetylglucosamine transferase